MSAARQWVVKCDAEKASLPPCPREYVSDEQSLIRVRRGMRKQGWARKHHNDGTVDLCSHCVGSAKVVTPANHGRPRKVAT